LLALLQRLDSGVREPSSDAQSEPPAAAAAEESLSCAAAEAKPLGRAAAVPVGWAGRCCCAAAAAAPATVLLLLGLAKMLPAAACLCAEGPAGEASGDGGGLLAPAPADGLYPAAAAALGEAAENGEALLCCKDVLGDAAVTADLGVQLPPAADEML